MKPKILQAYGATRTKTRVVERMDNGSLILRYRGAIDDNHQDASAVEVSLADAVVLLEGKQSLPPQPRQ